MKNRWEIENLLDIIIKSQNKLEVLNKLGLKPFTGNYDTLNKYIKEHNIDTSHFNRKIKSEYHPRIDLKYILVENSSYPRTHLKKRLYSENIKSPICELCGQDENWNGMKISLILDHINGINDDNRIENLRIICPNCNAGLDTHCGKNITKKPKKQTSRPIKRIKGKYYCKNCNKEISKTSKLCIDCHNLTQRRVERPPLDKLLKEISEMGYSATGRKYGVSDNSIRKWIKNYNK